MSTSTGDRWGGGRDAKIGKMQKCCGRGRRGAGRTLPAAVYRRALQCLAVPQCCGKRGRDDDEAAVWWDGQAVLREERESLG
jgi:hypothetical protein